MIELTTEQIRAMQLKSLEAFEYLRDFCEKHGLNIYFCGGCCIGALRHKGFVPWDDDVDAFMPRPDYERLAELWPQYADVERYAYVRPTEEMVTGDLMAKICDNTTTCILDYQKNMDIPQGLMVDLLPLDGYPANSWTRKLQVFWALIFSLFCAQSVPVKHGRLLAFGSRVLLGLFRSKRVRYRIWRFAESKMTATPFGSTDSVTELCSGPGYMKNRYPYAAFSSTAYHDFENEQMPLPVGADEYLRIAFGDYLTLPPKDSQKPHHDIIFLDLNTPYLEYRGKEYLVEGRVGS